MPNVNSQTIYQMGNVVNDIVKQATGRDAVQAIEMAHVTVEQNTLLGIETQSGSVVRFRTPKSVPLLTLEAQIVAQQNLHGQTNPYPAGGGRNLLPFGSLEGIKSLNTTGTWDGNKYERNGITFTVLTDDGGNVLGIKADGTSNGGSSIQVKGVSSFSLPAGSYKFYGVSETAGGYDLNLRKTGEQTDLVQRGTSVYLNLAEDTEFVSVYIWVNTNRTLSDVYIYPMICASSDDATIFSPYSNICPITGFTGCNITVSDGDTTEHVYPVEWETEAGTVYGGVLDAKNGKLIIKYALLDMGSVTWRRANNFFRHGMSDYKRPASAATPNAYSSMYKIVSWNAVNSNRFEIAFSASAVTPEVIVGNPNYTDVDAFKTAMSGVQLVYELAEPVEYDVTPVAINTLAGDNVVSADTGDISLSYYVYSDLL